ncbi:MAG: VWA domain-containing protein [Bacteroidia bacterium]|nr:VWA domain-containing protein [Bacteroidia bacterium]
MFRFENEYFLYALFMVPLLLALFGGVMWWRKRKLKQLGNLKLLDRLTPQYSRYKHWTKSILILLSLGFLIIGWANPQWGTKKEKVKRKSIDVFLAMDISNSMLAEDIAPSRMERTRNFTVKLIDQLKGERIGLILFAGNAYLQMPLTTDYAAAELFVRSANPSQAPAQGTAISEAIDLAEQSFSEDNKQHKVLIVLSDGENHDEEALERAQSAAANGLLIFAIGVGTPNGGYIPQAIGGRRDFKRDSEGAPIMTRLNEQMLADLASAGNGSYFNLAEGEKIVDALKTSLDRVEKRELEQRSFSEFESYFQYFIGIGLLLLIVEFLIPYTRSGILAGKDLFSSN